MADKKWINISNERTGDNKSIKFDIDSKLSVVRTSLTTRSVMNMTDRFQRKGAEIDQADEADTALKDITTTDGDDYSLSIKAASDYIEPEQEPEPEPDLNAKINVAFKSSNGKSTNLKVALNSTLATIRTQLTGANAMKSKDRFLRKGSEIMVADEESSALSEIVSGDAEEGYSVEIKVPKSKIDPDKTIKPDKPDVPDSDQTLTPAKTPDFHDVDQPTGSSKTEDAVTFGDLDHVTIAGIVKSQGLRRPLTLSYAERKDGISTSDKVVIWSDNLESLDVLPTGSSQDYIEYTYSEKTKEVWSRSVTEASAELGVAGIGGASASYEKDEESSTTTSKKDIYLIGLHDSPKAHFKIQEENISISQAFVDKIKVAVSNNKSDLDACFDLLSLLSKQGFFVATEFVLGGKITATDHKQIESTQSAEKVKEGFAVAFKAEYGGVSGGASGGHSESSGTNTTDISEFQTMSKFTLGGDDACRYDLAEWLGSLGPAKFWKVITIKGLIPILKFIRDDDLATRCAFVLAKYSGRADAKRYAEFDLVHYGSSIQAMAEPDDF